MSVWWCIWEKWWKISQEQRAESAELLLKVGTGVFLWQGPWLSLETHISIILATLQAWKGLGRNWFVEHSGFTLLLEPFFLCSIMLSSKKLSSHLYRVRPKPEIKTSFDFCSRVGVERRPLKWIYWIFLESTFRQIGLRSGPKKTFLSSLMSPMSKLKDFLSFITLWGWTLIVTWIWR